MRVVMASSEVVPYAKKNCKTCSGAGIKVVRVPERYTEHGELDAKGVRKAVERARPIVGEVPVKTSPCGYAVSRFLKEHATAVIIGGDESLTWRAGKEPPARTTERLDTEIAAAE